MSDQAPQRRLAAILAADVVGYSRLMQADEAGTLAALKSRRAEILQPLVSKHRGRIIKVMGDGVLVEFASAVEAVSCAVALQEAMAVANEAAEESHRVVLRIGINLGDVMVEGGDLYGDGVNIAARLEGLAEPGCVVVAQTLLDHVRGKTSLTFEDLGEQSLKNIVAPVRIYRVSRAVTPAAAMVPPKSLALPDKPSIAVLPFNNMSGDPEQEYLSDGITEDIITELSRFRSLFVIARNTSFQYRGKDIDVKRVGKELGVQFVLEGSIRKLGDRMRVTTQLIDTLSGSHAWADRYDRDLHDILALQDDVVHTVAATVGGRVEATGRERAARLSPAALGSYDLHLRAKAAFLRFTKGANEQALVLGHRAIEADPNNALALAYYALYWSMTYQLDWVEDLDQALRTSLEFARKAVALDDADSTARWILSVVFLTMSNFPEARIHTERALELNPNDTEARCIYAWFLACAGKPHEAIEQLEIAWRHNPFDIGWLPWVKGQAYFNARRYDEAIATFATAHDSNNEIKVWLAASYAHVGRATEATEKLQEFLQVAEREMVHFPGRKPEEWRTYLHRVFPFKEKADFAHLYEGLQKAGLPL
jgi:TolB-like protein